METSTGNLNIQSMNNNLNPLTYFDQLVQIKIVNAIENLSKKINVKNMFMLIILFGAESIKKIIIELMQKMIDKIKNTSYQQYYYLKNKYFTKKIENSIPYIIEPINIQNIEFSPTNIFYDNLYNFIQKNKDNVSYNEEIKDIKQINKDEYEINKEYNKLQISNNELKINFNTTINYTFDNNNNLKNSKIVEINNINSNVNSYFDYVPFPQFVKEAKEWLGCRSFNYNTHRFCSTNLRPIFGELNGNELFVILFSNRKEATKYSHSIYYILELDNNYSLFTKSEFTLFGKKIKLTKFLNNCNYYIDTHVSIPEFSQSKEVRKWVDAQLNNEATSNINNQITLQSEDLSINLVDEFQLFINTVNSYCNIIKDGNNISIYDINIKLENIIIKRCIPPKTITNEHDKTTWVDPGEPEVTEIKKSIQTNLVNTIYKDFSTLYLKEKDSLNLTSILGNFKNKNEMYKTLGLPYKFGALLYGEPGTGKSASIMAISSYLQRDIYYLNLSEIKNNSELKMVFSYINKEISKNGILVMEDIDIMSNIVHKRETTDNENELTLECILNLLQGTLTADGSMFIITTNNIEILDPAFVRDGRFDVKIHLEACNHYQMNLIYNKFFNRNIPEEIVKKIPDLKITPATFIYKLLKYYLSELPDNEILSEFITPDDIEIVN